MHHFQTIGNGSIPIVLHLPHNSTYLPTGFEWNLDQQTLDQEIHRLVDHYTLELFLMVKVMRLLLDKFYANLWVLPLKMFR